MFHCGFQNGEFLILSFHLHLLAVNDVIFQKEEEGSGDLNSEKPRCRRPGKDRP